MKRFTKALADYNANPYDAVNHKYKTRPTFKFVVDNRKLTEAFIEVANELRRANGVTQDLALEVLHQNMQKNVQMKWLLLVS